MPSPTAWLLVWIVKGFSINAVEQPLADHLRHVNVVYHGYFRSNGCFVADAADTATFGRHLGLMILVVSVQSWELGCVLFQTEGVFVTRSLVVREVAHRKV